VFQPLSSLTRNNREIRYLVTPANLVWSSGAVLVADARGAARPREPIGLDAQPGSSWAGRTRPLVVLMVVGETARAANWGLGGYQRQTTPALARLGVDSGVVNFTDVTSCGTDTETSLPCMFAPVGRRRYDEARIRGQQSLLHVVARAGVTVDWRDNQSGCKGVCDTLPAQTVDTRSVMGPCDSHRCLDEVLIQDLAARLKQAKGTQLWVLHTLGNHGPSYYRRYPEAFARFQADCRDDDLRKCTPQQVVNAYDNALLYTDHLLASAIGTLKAASADVDTALLYVSDHGESLGEHGLFLHGLPYAIAPDVQKRVPMVWWSSPGFERATGLADGCLAPTLARRAREPVAHDHLFHTLLGALDVRTALHEPALDLMQPCRAAKGSL
jgi:lipid A ethanolaminephosphotransferase